MRFPRFDGQRFWAQQMTRNGKNLIIERVAKRYDEAFQRQAVEMVLQGGKTVREVAENLGVSQYSIYQWKKKFFPLVAMPGSPQFPLEL